MPTYKVTDPTTGRTVRLTGDSPPSEQELETIFATIKEKPAGPSAGATIESDKRGLLQRGFDAIPSQGIPGVLKGAVNEGMNTVRAGGDLLRAGWNAVAPDSMDVERPYQQAGARPATTPYEQLGARGVQAYEAVTGARGVAAGARAVPEMTRRALGVSTARASAKLDDVAAAANSVPLRTSGLSKPLTELMELDAAGGNMTKPVKKLIDRITDPSLPDLTFEEGRRFYQNVSRLSNKELSRITPVIRREIVKLRGALHEALTDAADTKNLGHVYQSAMKEYAKGAKLSANVREKSKIVGKAAAQGAGLGLGAKLFGLFD